MSRGRKAELKAIDGGLAGVPRAPEGLDAPSAAEWQTLAADLVARKMLTDAMLGALETYVTALWLVRECRAALARDGLVVPTAHKVPKPHPAAGQLRKAQETVARLAAEFGFTPAALSKKSLQPKESRDDGAPAGLDL